MDSDNVSKLRDAVKKYRDDRPTHSGNPSDTCTVGELNALQESTAKIFDAIIYALDR